MLKFYVRACEAAHRLLTDKRGVVSLEYVVVAVAVVTVVGLVFNGTGTTTLKGILTTGFSNIATAM
jgi:Flp pilus assembly pilin Flp